MATNPRKDWLTGLMLEWAEFMEKAESAGWGSETAIYRAVRGEGRGEFGSRLPTGLAKLTTYGQLKELVVLLKELSERKDKRVCEPVKAIKAFYLHGRDKAELIVGVKSGKFNYLLKQGESIIAAKLEPPRQRAVNN